MNIEQDTALTEIHSLAQKYGWTQLMTLADEIRSAASAHRVIVATPSGTDISSFQNWVREVTSDGKVHTLTLEELSVNPASIITAEKPIAVFESGRLIEADAAAVVMRTFLSRPAGSYAIVMSYAERIEVEEDLDLMERSIRRLLFSTSISSWEKQDLLELGVYLWSNSHPAEWLKSRLQRDQDALIAWLRTAIPIDSALTNSLTRYRTLYALDMAEDQLNREERARTPRPSIDQSQRIYHARQSIGELKTQLLRQMDTSASSVERTLVTSLQTLQADLLGNLHPFMVQHREITSGGENVFREAIARYIAEGAKSWQSRADRLLATSGSHMVTDTETLAQGVDWPLVNQLAVQRGKLATYPEVLVEAFVKETTSVAPELKVEPQVTASSQGRISQSALETALMAVIGGGVTSSVALLLRLETVLGPAGIVASGVAGAVGIGILNYRRRSSQRENDHEEYGRALIQHTIREASFRVQEQVQANRQALRRVLETELSTVEAILDQALHESRSSLKPDNSFPVERERLQEYRRKITANSG